MVINKFDFEKIYKKNYSKVYNYIFYRTLNENLTEDLVSEIFLKVLSKFDKYNESKSNVSTWILAIAKNTLIDYYRKNKLKNSNECSFNDFTNNLLSNCDMENEITNNILKNNFLSVIKTLKEKERTALFLKYFCGMSYKQIGKHLECPECSVGIIIKRALLKIKKKSKIQEEDK